MITDNEKSKAVLEDPLILILSCKLSSLTQILPVLEKCHQTKKPLFIIAIIPSRFLLETPKGSSVWCVSLLLFSSIVIC